MKQRTGWYRWQYRLVIGLAGFVFQEGGQSEISISGLRFEEPAHVYQENRQFDMLALSDQRRGPVGTNLWPARAFWGAPPLMPHSFAGERDGRYCLECHAREDRIEKRQKAIAPVPHAEFTQCQQCHVSGVRRDLPPFRENEFVGWSLPGKGSRAHPLAPPTVPHALFMRENCLSCHGPTGHHRIATPHPWRSQCLQCHVPERDRDPTAGMMGTTSESGR